VASPARRAERQARGAPLTLIELVVSPAAGCASFGDSVRMFVGNTEAQTITLQPGLATVALSVERVVRSAESGAPALPSTGRGAGHLARASRGSRGWRLSP